MDGHGDAETNVKSICDNPKAQPPIFRKESEYREYRDGYCERDGGMRRRPTPEDTAAQKAKSECTADISADDVRGLGAAGSRFICRGDEKADEFSLTDRPSGQKSLGTFAHAAERKKEKRQGNGQDSADDDGGKHP